MDEFVYLWANHRQAILARLWKRLVTFKSPDDMRVSFVLVGTKTNILTQSVSDFADALNSMSDDTKKALREDD